MKSYTTESHGATPATAKKSAIGKAAIVAALISFPASTLIEWVMPETHQSISDTVYNAGYWVGSSLRSLFN